MVRDSWKPESKATASEDKVAMRNTKKYLEDEDDLDDYEENGTDRNNNNRFKAQI